jgi:hypothetical protein
MILLAEIALGDFCGHRSRPPAKSAVFAGCAVRNSIQCDISGWG